MIQYASQDVQYLPQVYEKMRKLDIFDKEVVDNVTEGGKIYQCTTKVYHKILSDTRKCIGYGFINRNITDVSTLKIDTYIQAFIKNIQKKIVFCSLNLGVSGVIKDDESIKNIKDNFKSIGDIVKVQVTGFEKSGKIILKYVEQSINCLS
jgi:transcriptional accessory protein Tex/SPT6